MSIFSFSTSLDRDGLEQEVRVLAGIEKRQVSVLEVEFEGPSLSDTELHRLHDCAVDYLCHR